MGIKVSGRKVCRRKIEMTDEVRLKMGNEALRYDD